MKPSLELIGICWLACNRTRTETLPWIRQNTSKQWWLNFFQTLQTWPPSKQELKKYSSPFRPDTKFSKSEQREGTWTAFLVCMWSWWMRQWVMCECVHAVDFLGNELHRAHSFILGPGGGTLFDNAVPEKDPSPAVPRLQRTEGCFVLKNWCEGPHNKNKPQQQSFAIFILINPRLTNNTNHNNATTNKAFAICARTHQQ